MAEIKKGCVHVNYTRSNKNKNNDLCLIKEVHVDEKGNVTRDIKPVINAKRDWWITLPQHRKHKSKKEWECLTKLKKVRCNQATLIPSVAKELKQRPHSIKVLNRSPYVYGTDVKIESVIKNHYDKKCPDVQINPTLAVMDYEWRISTKELTVGAFVYEDKCHLTINKDIIKHIDDPLPKLQHLFAKYLLPYIDEYYKKMNLKTLKKILTKYYPNDKEPNGSLPDGTKVYNDIYSGDVLAYYDSLDCPETFFNTHLMDGRPAPFEKRRDYKLEVEICDHALDVTRKLFKHTHIYKPDYLTFWWGESDFTTIQENCDKFNVEMSSFTTDPKILSNPKLASFVNSKFHKGMESKLDTNGAEKKIDDQERWHHFENMASWQFADLMAIYAVNRVHLPNKPSYGLDYILNTEIGLNKFKFTDVIAELDNLAPDKWHDVMTEKYPLEYCIYAMFDVIGPQLLEDQTADIRGQFYPKLGTSVIQNFKKNPRRLCDKSHFDFLEKGYAIGSTSDKMVEALDERLYSTDNWIITLDSGLHSELGSRCLEGLPEIFTTFIPKVIDADITSSYPSTGRFLNTAKATTVTELIKTSGISEAKMREIGMNISAGKGVAIEYCTELLGLPHVSGWSEMYQKDKKIKEEM